MQQRDEMYLAALELHGFKSFAKSTRLAFERGITCIVGPNGSGKSGIADGIRWVLGEQSLKSIRAKRGEDVIFQGSPTRPRLGAAEVSLTLADAEVAGLDTPELVLTRRIDRSGVSEYLVNGRPVRLLDLAELLAGAGFAQKSYTVIPQGMIDALVTASPQERRQMFEDATGVTPLLLKQEQTERKLEATRQQVQRAKDLLRELEPRLRSLKRAASRARSRAEVETSLRAHEETFAAHRWAELARALADVAERRKRSDERLHTTRAALAELRAAQAPGVTNLEQLPELRQSLERLAAEERELVIALGRADAGALGDVDRRAEEITARTKEREKLGNELGEVKAALAEARGERQRLAGELAKLHAVLLPPRGGPERPAGGDLAEDLAAFRTRAAALAARLRRAAAADLPALATDADALAADAARLAERARGPRTGAEQPAATAVRLRSLASEQARVAERLETLHGRAAALAERIRTVEERLAWLKEQSPHPAAATPERLAAVQRELASRKREVAALEDALLRAHTERLRSQEEERSHADAVHAAERESAAVAVEEGTLRARRDDLRRDVTERLDAAFTRRLEAGEILVTGTVDLEALRSEIERLRKRLLEIGGMDESVLAEESAVEKRVTELQMQVSDLEAARKNLRGALRELERHIHDRFGSAFRAMDEQFNRTFREIFGGGRASLSLVKPQPIAHAFPDVPPDEAEYLSREAPPAGGAEWDETSAAHVHELPAGVEIHVHLPGKKIQHVSQLSGGEKALTSIALLFAILGQRASPFVVLDEVDAALDEANSRRFARLLSGLAERTQFIVITHNRATMEAAKILYGVTMGDEGVSQLLSVKLADVPADATRGHRAAVPAPS